MDRVLNVIVLWREPRRHEDQTKELVLDSLLSTDVKCDVLDNYMQFVDELAVPLVKDAFSAWLDLL